MPRIEETSVEETESKHTAYQGMYNEEEVSLMNELLGEAEQPPDTSCKHSDKSNNDKSSKGRKGVAVHAIYPSEGEDPCSEPWAAAVERPRSGPLKPLRETGADDLTTQSMSSLEGKLQQCLLTRQAKDQEEEANKQRPSSASRLMSPSSSRRILNIVSGFMNRKNSCKVHIDDTAQPGLGK